MADTKNTTSNPSTSEPIVKPAPTAPSTGQAVKAQGEPIVKPQGEPIVKP